MEPARDQVCEGLTADGLKEQPQGELKQLFETRAEGDDSELFKTRAWWEDLLKKDCGDRCEVTVEEAECFDTAWQEWFDTGHEFGIRDREFPGKGLDRILDFVLICVRKKQRRQSLPAGKMPVLSVQSYMRMTGRSRFPSRTERCSEAGTAGCIRRHAPMIPSRISTALSTIFGQNSVNR